MTFPKYVFTTHQSYFTHFMFLDEEVLATTLKYTNEEMQHRRVGNSQKLLSTENWNKFELN